MKRSFSFAAVICAVCLISTACQNNERTRNAVPSSSVHSTTAPKESGSYAIPSSSKNTAPSDAADLLNSKAETSEAVFQRNFFRVIPLRMPEGFFVERMIVSGTNEAVLIFRRDGPEEARIVRMNLTTREMTEVWRAADSYVFPRNLKASIDEDGRSSLEWLAYDRIKGETGTYREVGGEVTTEAAIAQKSPNGKLTAAYGSIGAGIWGRTGGGTSKYVQWTSGEKDDHPLWLPDSSGFVYLRDTGKQIGDGAGPVYALAKFDIRTRKTTDLPFDHGFWGGIQWLVPGKTIQANNGFDDVKGIKVVDLAAGTEKQLVLTENPGHLTDSFNPVDKKLLVSDLGKFTFYNDRGDLLSELPWPTGLDEYTSKNPEFIDGSAPNVAFYNSTGQGGDFGISLISFSPDGSRLSYRLGAASQGDKNVVQGTRLVIANSDGSGAKWATDDYLEISEYVWFPSSDRILALFSLPHEDSRNVYLGLVNVVSRPTE